MGFNKGDIVVCIKLDDYGHLEIGKKYEIYDSIEMTDQHVIQIVDYNSGKSLGFYSMNNFTQIDEWRDEKIKKILEQ
jgi:hypothetical protein